MAENIVNVYNEIKSVNENAIDGIFYQIMMSDVRQDSSFVKMRESNLQPEYRFLQRVMFSYIMETNLVWEEAARMRISVPLCTGRMMQVHRE